MKNILNNVKRKWEWRRRNAHNGTAIDSGIVFERLTVGNGTYGLLKVLDCNTDAKLKIGHFCSIAGGAAFILNADHRTDTISTFPFKVKLLRTAKYEAVSKGDIIVGDDVWIGENAIILSGLHIGQGAVIAAGAVVTKDVPPYAIAGGNPARVIKYRFDDEIIRELLKIDYGRLTKEMVRKHIDEMYTKIQSAEQVRAMEWLPRRRA